MNRTQWKLFAIFMTCIFLPVPFLPWHPQLIIVTLVSVVLLLGSTVGWMAVRAIRNTFVRHTGVQTAATVIHARSSGYSNYVPTWEIDVRLPDGNTATLMVTRHMPFTPGEPITVIVDPKHPTVAALPPSPTYDF